MYCHYQLGRIHRCGKKSKEGCRIWHDLRLERIRRMPRETIERGKHGRDLAWQGHYCSSIVWVSQLYHHQAKAYANDECSAMKRSTYRKSRPVWLWRVRSCTATPIMYHHDVTYFHSGAVSMELEAFRTFMWSRSPINEHDLCTSFVPYFAASSLFSHTWYAMIVWHFCSPSTKPAHLRWTQIGNSVW